MRSVINHTQHHYIKKRQRLGAPAIKQVYKLNIITADSDHTVTLGGIIISFVL